MDLHTHHHRCQRNPACQSWWIDRERSGNHQRCFRLRCRHIHRHLGQPIDSHRSGRRQLRWRQPSTMNQGRCMNRHPCRGSHTCRLLMCPVSWGNCLPSLQEVDCHRNHRCRCRSIGSHHQGMHPLHLKRSILSHSFPKGLGQNMCLHLHQGIRFCHRLTAPLRLGKRRLLARESKEHQGQRRYLHRCLCIHSGRQWTFQKLRCMHQVSFRLGCLRTCPDLCLPIE